MSVWVEMTYLPNTLVLHSAIQSKWMLAEIRIAKEHTFIHIWYKPTGVRVYACVCVFVYGAYINARLLLLACVCVWQFICVYACALIRMYVFVTQSQHTHNTNTTLDASNLDALIHVYASSQREPYMGNVCLSNILYSKFYKWVWMEWLVVVTAVLMQRLK